MTEISSKTYDALVIGSGAAGSMAVKELTERGMDVLLLEAGRQLTDEDFKPSKQNEPKAMGIGMLPRLAAGVRGQYQQARRAFFVSRTNGLFVNDLQNPYTTPRGAPFLWIRGRMLGGRLNTYGRVLQRMSELDFRGRTRDGSGEDWPIHYSDLEPYYDRVEQFIGIHGHTDGLEQLPDGKYQAESRMTEAEKAFQSVVQSKWDDRKVIPWRYAAANPNREPLGILAARKTGRLTVRTDAVVTRIEVDDTTGRATGAVFIDRRTKKEHRVSANIVMLCASTIESIRLLLNSGSTKHPNGLGNSSGLLGRYFMDQTPSMTFGTLPNTQGWEPDPTVPFDPVYPAAGGVLVPRFANLNGSPEGFQRGFSYQGAVGRFPVPEDHPAVFALMGFGEMLPYYDNRVSLSGWRRDAWGVPAAHINCRPTANEILLMREQVKVAGEMAAAAGYRINLNGTSLGLDSGELFPDADPFSRLAFRLGFRRTAAIGAAVHESGGARMGSDPKTSVLNEFNQSWDVPNLFVTDASSFVSVGFVGPTLTIMALTARACEHIANEYAAGTL